MRLAGMYFVNGATAREFQAGKLVMRFLKWDCWCWRNVGSIVRCQWWREKHEGA